MQSFVNLDRSLFYVDNNYDIKDVSFHVESDIQETSRPVPSSSTSSSDYRSDWEGDLHKTKKKPVVTKNAIQARENRRKKKMYIQTLEEEVQKLKLGNREQTVTIQTQECTIRELRMEIKHLRSVLANSKELCILINSIKTATGLPTTSSLLATQSTASMENWSGEIQLIEPGVTVQYPGFDSGRLEPNIHNDLYDKIDTGISADPCLLDDEFTDLLDEWFLSTKETNVPDAKNNDLGVCLHVKNKRVSVEFCSKCTNGRVF